MSVQYTASAYCVEKASDIQHGNVSKAKTFVKGQHDVVCTSGYYLKRPGAKTTCNADGDFAPMPTDTCISELLFTHANGH